MFDLQTLMMFGTRLVWYTSVNIVALIHVHRLTQNFYWKSPYNSLSFESCSQSFIKSQCFIQLPCKGSAAKFSTFMYVDKSICEWAVYSIWKKAISTFLIRIGNIISTNGCWFFMHSYLFSCNFAFKNRCVTYLTIQCFYTSLQFHTVESHNVKHLWFVSYNNIL